MIPIEELKNDFEKFLVEDGVSLESVSSRTLFQQLVKYFSAQPVEGTARMESTLLDYLHFECSSDRYYFERIVYIPSNNPNSDYEEDDAQKHFLAMSPSETNEIDSEFPKVNLWSLDFPNMDEFSQIVLNHPALQALEASELRRHHVDFYHL